jgi:hypothetical protein
VIATGNDDFSQSVAERIGQFIIEADARSDRSRQVAIGPSEIGNPCRRAIAYKVLDWPESNTARDPIAAIIGTGFHMWMAEQFDRRNGGGRYKIEQRVVVRDSTVDTARITGSADLFDLLTALNLDWKLTGKSSLEKYRRHGPGPKYRVQAHLYGLGQENAGLKPARVAVVFIGRYHELIIHVWSEPYDRQVALDALDRLDEIRQQVLDLDVEANPGAWGQIPMGDNAECRFCPWLKPGSASAADGCPGIASLSTRTGFEGITG